MARFVDGLRDRWHDLSDWFYYDVPRWSKGLGLMAVVVVVCGTAFWLLRPADSSESRSLNGSRPISTPSDETLAPLDSEDETRSETGAAAETTVSAPRSTARSEPTTPPEPTAPAIGSNSVPTETTTATTTETTAETASLAPPATTDTTFGYPTGPDGLPLPIVVMFDTETITISGQVPSEAARDRIVALAVANSQFPDPQVIDDMVINPAVPISVGVRVIELDSVRFPEGSAEILPEHALGLDRIVNIMQAFPNTSVLVVGHADQRGDDTSSFAIADQRARAVANYLRYLGISPTRSSTRAAVESDLRADADDPLSLALDRRTEFVFYGILTE